MYNPYPYDDPRAINKPVLAPQTIESVTAGTPQAAVRLAREFAETLKATPQRNLIVAFDGYTTADWTRTINLLSQQLGLLGIGFEADTKRCSTLRKSKGSHDGCPNYRHPRTTAR